MSIKIKRDSYIRDVKKKLYSLFNVRHDINSWFDMVIYSIKNI